ERRVVIAERTAEKHQSGAKSRAFDRERQHEQELVASSARNDRGLHPCRRSDAALRRGEPVESLEGRAVGALLEVTPLLLHRVDIAGHRKLGDDVGDGRRLPIRCPWQMWRQLPEAAMKN